MLYVHSLLLNTVLIPPKLKDRPVRSAVGEEEDGDEAGDEDDATNLVILTMW
jgi:hypothetical protein